MSSEDITEDEIKRTETDEEIIYSVEDEPQNEEPEEEHIDEPIEEEFDEKEVLRRMAELMKVETEKLNKEYIEETKKLSKRYHERKLKLLEEEHETKVKIYDGILRIIEGEEENE